MQTVRLHSLKHLLERIEVLLMHVLNRLVIHLHLHCKFLLFIWPAIFCESSLSAEFIRPENSRPAWPINSW